QVTYTDSAHALLAIDPFGTAYATALSDASGTHVYASTDARTWSARGVHPAGELDIMTALANGTLLADSFEAGGHVITRSTDQGVTWTDVLPQGQYRALTPHSFAELDGVVYFIQYQTFTETATPIQLYASNDGGATWSVRFTFQSARHGHGLTADPTTHTLWALFGDTDAQSGVYRSIDGGATWQFMLGNQDGDVVDATPLPGGGLLFGQDISFLPTMPSVAMLTSSGQYTILAPIIGPSYSIHALALGGFVVGSEREADGDIYPPGEVSAHLYGSPDGVAWTRLLDYPRLVATDDVRADVYWELPSTHELVVTMYNASGFGPGGKGYQLVRRQ
ncbi:MAG TPA: sialidase family protein, partial [Polyangia bacterium]